MEPFPEYIILFIKLISSNFPNKLKGVLDDWCFEIYEEIPQNEFFKPWKLLVLSSWIKTSSFSVESGRFVSFLNGHFSLMYKFLFVKTTTKIKTRGRELFNDFVCLIKNFNHHHSHNQVLSCYFPETKIFWKKWAKRRTHMNENKIVIRIKIQR